MFLLLFSHSVMSYSLQPHGLQHARLLSPSLSPRVCSNSCTLSHRCYLTISSSAAPFSCCRAQALGTGSVAVTPRFSSCCLRIPGHTGFRSCVAHGLSCSVAGGIFLGQGSNLCPLHWQADSLCIALPVAVVQSLS